MKIISKRSHFHTSETRTPTKSAYVTSGYDAGAYQTYGVYLYATPCWRSRVKHNPHFIRHKFNGLEEAK